MVAPLPCGKLEATRGVGARPLALRGTAGRPAAALVGALAIAVASAALTVTGQEATHGGLIVSSTLERIVAPPPGAAAASVVIATDTVASHADQLIVTVRFSNSSTDVLDSIRITSPVPADVQYVPESASAPGGEVLFSVDNGRTFGSPGELTISVPDGGERAADASDYTHVRWVLRAPLDAGALGVARFRAVPR
jgi:uncharacterized repeat protein (TIGR01451 family)